VWGLDSVEFDGLCPHELDVNVRRPGGSPQWRHERVHVLVDFVQHDRNRADVQPELTGRRVWHDGGDLIRGREDLNPGTVLHRLDQAI
jgi:hypothetical protein